VDCKQRSGIATIGICSSGDGQEDLEAGVAIVDIGGGQPTWYL
jgi:hypothetical protein